MNEISKTSSPEYQEIIQLRDQTVAQQSLKLRVVLNESSMVTEEQSLINGNETPETQLNLDSKQVAFEKDIELQQQTQDLQISVNVNAALLERNEALEIEVQLLTRLLRDKEVEYRLHYRALEEQVQKFQEVLADLQDMKRKYMFLMEQKQNDGSRKLEETDKRINSPLGLQEETKKLPVNSGYSPASVKAPTQNASIGPSEPEDQTQQQLNQLLVLQQQQNQQNQRSDQTQQQQNQLLVLQQQLNQRSDQTEQQQNQQNQRSEQNQQLENQLLVLLLLVLQRQQKRQQQNQQQQNQQPSETQPSISRRVISGIANTFLRMYRTGTLRYWVDYWYF